MTETVTNEDIAAMSFEQALAALERIVEDSDRDRWFTAQEAKEYGFVDHVVTSLKETAE